MSQFPVPPPPGNQKPPPPLPPPPLASSPPPPVSLLPLVSDIQRLTIKPGDRLIVKVSSMVNMKLKEVIGQSVRNALRLGDDISIIVADSGIDISVIEGP